MLSASSWASVLVKRKSTNNNNRQSYRSSLWSTRQKHTPNHIRGKRACLLQRRICSLELLCIL